MAYRHAYIADKEESERYPVECPDRKLAQAYVPFQELRELWCPKEGLDKGTIFPELFRPYCKKKGKRRYGCHY